MNRLSLRKKILISYVVVFLMFLTFIYLFTSYTVNKIVNNSILERSTELIRKIQNEPNDDALVQRLKDQKYLIFFRVSLITNERRVLYDSYTKRLLGPGFNKRPALNHPEVEQAFAEGIGFHEDYSTILRQRFVYMAKAFDFQGKRYVLRTAFPTKFVADLTKNIELGFLALAGAVLFLFSIMSWFIINRLTSPIQQIITAITPYQEGHTGVLPEIDILKLNSPGDFGKLASTLNSLSARIQIHINTLTHERNEKSAVLESLVEGVVAVNEHLIVTYANHAAFHLLGCTSNELIGQDFRLIPQKTCIDLLIACQCEKKVMTGNLEIQRDDNKKLYLDAVAAPKKDNTGAVLVMEDKTNHYKLLEMRKEFIANASHELKTPVTIIRGAAEMLHENPDLSPEIYSNITEKIVRNCKRMGTLIKNLLSLTDIEHLTPSRLMECDLHDLVQNCCDILRDLFPTAHITIHKLCEEDINFTGDPNLFEMAIMNLLENAAKYSKGPAEITVLIGKENDRIKLTIADKGIGIPENDLEHIFQRFYTVNKVESRKQGGAGLGLSIVETVIEKHYGKISVASKLNEGSTFTILLPQQ